MTCRVNAKQDDPADTSAPSQLRMQDDELSEIDIALCKIGVIAGYMTMVIAAMAVVGWAFGARVN